MARVTPVEQTDEKLVLFQRAFNVIRSQLVSPEMDSIYKTALKMAAENGGDPNQMWSALQSSIQMVRVISASERAAATAAAMLVGQGIKLTTVNYGDDE